MESYDVVIVGGGPAGSSLGTFLARAGIQTALFEKASFPRSKLCGEFIAPEGVRLLEELEVLERLKQQGARPVYEFGVVDREGLGLKGSLPEPGLGVSRRLLDYSLLKRADRAGVDVHEKTRVKEIDSGYDPSPEGLHRVVVRSGRSGESKKHTVKTRSIVGAYGRRSRLDRRLGRRFIEQVTPYVAFKRHFSMGPSTPFPERNTVCLYLVPGGYCGIVKIRPRAFNACLLVRKSSLDRRLPSISWKQVRKHLLMANPALRKLLTTSNPTEEPVKTDAQIPIRTKSCFESPFLFVGDACGMIAPFTGNGQTIAMASGKCLARFLDRTDRPRSEEAYQRTGERWETLWRNRFSTRVRTGRFLNRILMNGSTASSVLRWCRTFPAPVKFLIQNLIF